MLKQLEIDPHNLDLPVEVLSIQSLLIRGSNGTHLLNWHKNDQYALNL